MDWFDLLAVQGTVKSLLQHHSSKASILQCTAFSIVQLSHLYMATGKTIALTRQTFVGKVMSLLFNMLSRLVITFLPRRKKNFSFIPAVYVCFLEFLYFDIHSTVIVVIFSLNKLKKIFKGPFTKMVFRKDRDAGKIEGRRKGGQQRMR